jgi:hypothetical protein
MATSLDQARNDVQLAVSAAMKWAESPKAKTFYEFEKQLWVLVMGIGRTLVVLFLVVRAQLPRAANYQRNGRQLTICETFTNPLGCLFGKVDWSRPAGRRANNRRGAMDLPLDRELGLCGGFSLGVVARINKLSAQMVFSAALRSFRDVHGWAPASRTLLRMVDAVGALARPFLEEAGAPEGDGEILVGMADAGGAPTMSSRELRRRRRPRPRRASVGTTRHARRAGRRENPRPRRTKGKKSKNAKMAVVGVLYTLKRTPQGLEGPINKRLVATFESHDALFQWMRREADKRGYGTKPMVFLADGCDHIWRLQEKYFPKAEACVDWYHIVEKLWKAGECLYPEGSEHLRQWVAEQSRRLRRGYVDLVVRTILDAHLNTPKTGPGNKGKRERLETIFKHLDKNRKRLRYAELRRRDLDIGSGAVEGAVRNLIRLRLDGPGMRWGRGRSELVLHLRCILLNGQWDDFEAHLASLPQIKLPKRAAPTEPYDAQQKKAA